MDALDVPAGLVATLAVAAFAVALLGAVVAPLLSRLDRLAPWRGAIVLVPLALLMVAAALAVAASALGSVSAGRVGVREVATGALAVLCLTPVVGVLAVRGRYGAPGDRTFRQQIAANRASSVLLVAVLFEVVGVTAFLIGAGVGVGFGAALAGGLVLGGLSLAVTVGATAFALLRGDTLVLDLARARPAGPADRRLVNVVAELSTAAGIPAPAVFVIDVPAANALSIGRDPAHASIAITRGLLERLDREELQGVVAHELAHVANLDSRHALLVALLVGAVVLLTDVFLQVAIEVATHPWVGGDSLSEIVGSLAAWLVVAIVGLALAGVLRLFAPLAALAVQAAVSRDREYLADATSVGITRNPAGLVSALRKLEHVHGEMPDANRGTQHLWIVNPVREGRAGERGWFATHPATADRVARLLALSGMGDAGAPEGPPDPR